jgi:putative membrane protein
MNNAFVNLLVRWLVLAVGVVLSTKIVSGISYDTGETLAVVVLLLSFFNAVLKPLLLLFTLPFIVLTLGIGIWIINAVLFYFVGHLVTGFHVATFGAALWGALIVSVTNLILNRLLSPPRAPGPPPGPSTGPAKRDDVIDI